MRSQLPLARYGLTLCGGSSTRHAYWFAERLAGEGVATTLIALSMEQDHFISGLTSRLGAPAAPLNTSVIVQHPERIHQYPFFRPTGQGGPVLIIACINHLPECQPIHLTPPQVNRLVNMAPELSQRAHGFQPKAALGRVVLYVSPGEDDVVRYHLGATPIEGMIYLVPRGDQEAMNEVRVIHAGLQAVRGSIIPLIIVEFDDDSPDGPWNPDPGTMRALSAWLTSGQSTAEQRTTTTPKVPLSATAELAIAEQEKYRRRPMEATVNAVLEVANDASRLPDLLERFNQLVQRIARTERYEPLKLAPISAVVVELTKRLRARKIPTRIDRLRIDLATVCVIRARLAKPGKKAKDLYTKANDYLSAVRMDDLFVHGHPDALEFCWAQAHYTLYSGDAKYLKTTLEQIDQLRHTAKDVDVGIRQQRQVECWRMFAEVSDDPALWSRVVALCEEIRTTDPHYALFGLAVALMRLGRREDAKESLRELMSVSAADFELAMASDPELLALWRDNQYQSSTTSDANQKENLSNPGDHEQYDPEEIQPKDDEE